MSASSTFDELGVVVCAARRLAAVGTPIALHQAGELEGLADELLGEALASGEDMELRLDDFEGVGEDESEELGILDHLEEELEHAVDDVETLEAIEEEEDCPDCEDDLPPLGAPSPATMGSDQPVVASRLSRKKKAKKLGRRRYVACSPPELRRSSEGRKAWCSLCAWKRSSGALAWTYLPVGGNPLIKPRFALLGGRRIKFAEQTEIDDLLKRSDD
jgi:hypothetical protein